MTLTGRVAATLLAAAVAVACGGRTVETPKQAPAAQQAVAPAAAPAAADSVGVPECDEYITKYQQCIETKVPEAARGSMKQAFDQTRAAWKQAAATPQGKEGLAMGCKAALDGAKQAMTAYGCTW